MSSYQQHPAGGFSDSFDRPSFLKKCFKFSPLILIVLGIGWFIFRNDIARLWQSRFNPGAASHLAGSFDSGNADAEAQFATPSQRIESIRQMNVGFQSETAPIQIQIVHQKIAELKTIEKETLSDEDRLRLEATEVELYYLDHNLCTTAGLGKSKFLPVLQSLAENNSGIDVSPVTRRLALRRLIEVPLYYFKRNPSKESKAEIISALRMYGLSAIENKQDRAKLFLFLTDGITKIGDNQDYVDIANTVSEIAMRSTSDVCRSFGNDVEALKSFADFKPVLLRHNMSTHVSSSGEKVEELLDRFCEGSKSSVWIAQELGFLIELMNSEQREESQRLLQKLQTFVYEKSIAFEKAEMIRFFDFQQKRISLVGKEVLADLHLELKPNVEEKPLKVFAFVDFFDGSQLVGVKPLVEELRNESAAFNLFVINVGVDDEAVREFVSKNRGSKANFYSQPGGHPALKKLGLQMLPGAYLIVVDENGVVKDTPIDSINVLNLIDTLSSRDGPAQE